MAYTTQQFSYESNRFQPYWKLAVKYKKILDLTRQQMYAKKEGAKDRYRALNRFIPELNGLANSDGAQECLDDALSAASTIADFPGCEDIVADINAAHADRCKQKAYWAAYIEA